MNNEVTKAIDLFLNENFTEGDFMQSKAKVKLVKTYMKKSWINEKYKVINDLDIDELMLYLFRKPNRKSNVKYLKEWTGMITDSFAGRDNGYPTRKQSYYNTLEEMIETLGEKPEENYYRLENIQEEIDMIIKLEDEEEEKLNKIKDKRRIELEIKKLQEKLKEM